MVEPPIWKICSSKWIISPRFGVKINNIWNHHLVFFAVRIGSEEICFVFQKFLHKNSTRFIQWFCWMRKKGPQFGCSWILVCETFKPSEPYITRLFRVGGLGAHLVTIPQKKERLKKPALVFVSGTFAASYLVNLPWENLNISASLL